MAIPFLPSEEETENHYRAMDELWAQLYDVLRQILLRQNHRVPVPNNDQQRNVRHNQQQQQQQQSHEVDAPLPPAGAAMPDVLPRLPLPDVVSPPAQSVSSNHPRRPRRRRTQRRPDKKAASVHKIEVRDNWTQVGEDLRQIADEFGTSLEEIDPKRLEDSSSHKGVGFLSLLVPPSFRGSVWMGLIFLFGWQALQRTTR